MEIVLGGLLGLVLGWGATRTHPAVDAGRLNGAASGLLGGLLGQAWLGPALAPVLADATLAGAAAGGAIGGFVAGPLVAVGTKELRRRLAAREPRDH